MKKLVEGKIALVTGGGAGMGACDCWKFAEEGAKGILIVDLNVDDAEKVAKEIMAQYPECKCVAVKCNVAKEADVDHCFEVLDQEFGTLDILVNNAGITNKIPFDEMTLEHWNLTYSINITGAFLFAQRAMRIMKAKGYGRIINMSSIAGHVGGLTSGVDYATTKGAMLTLTKSVAKQGAAYGVTCNSIAPGNIKTAMEKVFGSDWDPMAVPMHRLGEPEDISDVVLFLASDMSRYMTGCCLNVNGGLFMQ
ncbi:SDR family NAD(P)-dependent oxidoreductase [uncultured Oscillibacter sp.]|uniref:SDR family NAD(P)-dependent oxidoreductase n=1 Tax=Dysosmobacter sp. TaxID=2591382 RepID=UPI00280386D7|nr:SDR family NAD(P)-dependent oxidoreductase [uncultured Oscillibacter sp.]